MRRQIDTKWNIRKKGSCVKTLAGTEIHLNEHVGHLNGEAILAMMRTAIFSFSFSNACLHYIGRDLGGRNIFHSPLLKSKSIFTGRYVTHTQHLGITQSCSIQSFRYQWVWE